MDDKDNLAVEAKRLLNIFNNSITPFPITRHRHITYAAHKLITDLVTKIEELEADLLRCSKCGMLHCECDEY